MFFNNHIPAFSAQDTHHSRILVSTASSSKNSSPDLSKIPSQVSTLLSRLSFSNPIWLDLAQASDQIQHLPTDSKVFTSHLLLTRNIQHSPLLSLSFTEPINLTQQPLLPTSPRIASTRPQTMQPAALSALPNPPPSVLAVEYKYLDDLPLLLSLFFPSPEYQTSLHTPTYKYLTRLSFKPSNQRH
jgi:hypothetical protein